MQCSVAQYFSIVEAGLLIVCALPQLMQMGDALPGTLWWYQLAAVMPAAALQHFSLRHHPSENGGQNHTHISCTTTCLYSDAY